MMLRLAAAVGLAGWIGGLVAMPAAMAQSGDRVLLPWQKARPLPAPPASTEKLPWQAPSGWEAQRVAKAARKPNARGPSEAAGKQAIESSGNSESYASEGGRLLETGGNPPAEGGQADDGWAGNEPEPPESILPVAAEPTAAAVVPVVAARPPDPAGAATSEAAPGAAAPKASGPATSDVGTADTAATVAPAKPDAPAKLPEGASATQQYCFNIADAAKDARYAWQKKNLEAIEQDLNTRIALLEERTTEFQQWLARRDDFVRKAEEGVVKIYAGMKPDAAAAQLAQMNEEAAAAVLTKLSTRSASQILAEMEAAKAAKLTMIITGAAKVAGKTSAAAPRAATEPAAATPATAAAPATPAAPAPEAQAQRAGQRS